MSPGGLRLVNRGELQVAGRVGVGLPANRRAADLAAGLLSFDQTPADFVPPRLKVLWIEDSTHHYCQQWSYYCDIKAAMSRLHDMCTPTDTRTLCLGPGSRFNPDIAVVGPHYASNVHRQDATLGFDRSAYPRLPLVVLQNKMYAWESELAGQVAAKLDWARAIGAVAAFTFLTRHHEFSNRSGVPHYWMPFGVDTRLYGQHAGEFGPAAQPFDVGFTGASGSKYPMREAILRTITALNVSAYLGTWSQAMLNRADARSWKPLNRKAYAAQLARTKIWVSTTGPENIVGTRFFEVLASGTTLLLCNRPPAEVLQSSPWVYDGLFEDGVHAVLFDGLDDLRSKILRFLRDEPARRRIVAAAVALARSRHSWDERARFVTRASLHAIAKHPPRKVYYTPPDPRRRPKSNATFVGCLHPREMPTAHEWLKPRTRLSWFTASTCELQCRRRNQSAFALLGGGFSNGMAHRLAKCSCWNELPVPHARPPPLHTCDFSCTLYDLRPCGGTSLAVYTIGKSSKGRRRRAGSHRDGAAPVAPHHVL